jgi:TRAP transporter 4TM/12TM fusion protein
LDLIDGRDSAMRRLWLRACSAFVSLARASVRRQFAPGPVRRTVYVFSVLLALYHLASTVLWGVVLDPHLIVHVCAVLALAFAVFSGPGGKTASVTRGDLVLIATSVVLGIYLLGRVDALLERALVVTPLPAADIVAAGVLLLLLFEGARRAAGLPFVAIMICFLLLMYLGPYLPGTWSHPGMDVVEILDVTVWSRLQGVWGIPLRMSSTLIALFLIFGKLMQHSGLGELFTSVVQALAGGSRGGPAKVAVIGSALVGSVTAGPVTNMVMTGSMTIPLMKKAGYKPHFAAAVEAAASTGAAIVPPVMTGIVFIMAELTSMSYLRIMLLAVIPAVLYYACILLQVHFQALKTGMAGSGRGRDMASVMKALVERGHLLLPVVILVGLLIDGHYPATAVLWAIPFVPLSAALRRSTRMSLRLILQALAEASQELVRIAPVCALSGIIIVALFNTGLGSAFSHVVSSAAGQSLLLLILLGGIASLVLGLGVPPTASYLMTVLIVAPVMVKAGLPVQVAHFFSLYYAILAFITPPDAVGALVAAGMAGAGFWPTSFTAMRLATVGFVVPVVFVYRPALLLLGSPLEILWALVACLILVVCLAAAFEGWLLVRLTRVERFALLGAGIALIPPVALANLVALAVAVVVLVANLARRAASSESPARP